MSIPLDTLLDFEGNSYEIVSAVIKRAQQLTDIRVAYNLTTLEEQGGAAPVSKAPVEVKPEEKAVSVAFQEIFDETVVYKMNPDTVQTL